MALLGPLAVAVVGNLGEATLLAGQVLQHLPLHASYWDPTRVITPGPGEPGPITEFPWFTFLYADLHAHLIALPYAVAVLAVSLAAVRRSPGASASSRVALYLLLAITLGALWPLNTWDYPVYALLALGALLSRAWQGPHQSGYRWIGAAALRWALVLALGYVLFLPFHRAYASAFAGLDPWRGSRTGIGEFLTIHGLFLFFIVSALGLDFWHSRDLAGPARLVRAILRRPFSARRMLRLHRRMVSPSSVYLGGVYAIEFGIFAALLLALVGQLVAALLVGIGTLACALMARRRRPLSAAGPDSVLWQAVLAAVAMGAALALAVEFVVVKEIDVGRMNTVFKVYQQVWALWGLAAALAAARLLRGRRLPTFRLRWRVVWGAAAAALLSAALLYPALATPAKVQDRFDRSVGPGLDGTAFMTRAVQVEHGKSMPLTFDLDAINWIQANVDGSPTVAEVNTTPVLYGWSSRYAMFTGNPDIVGWDNHERQQRGIAGPDGMISTRIDDIQRAYGTSDAAEAFAVFRRYRVKYFVVGPLERAYYDRGQQKWELSDGCLWQRIYRNPGVSIYQVIVSADPKAACNSSSSSHQRTGGSG
jgi:YYY domain-containing protein